MTLLMAAVGGLYVQLSAPYNDIADASGGGTTAGNTVTWTMATSATVDVSNPAVTAALRYSKNGGAFTSCPDGTGISMASGDTLRFDLQSGGAETFGVTLSIAGRTIDDFTCFCT